MLPITTYLLLAIIFILVLILFNKHSKIKNLTAQIEKTTQTIKMFNDINLPLFYKDKNGKFSGCNPSFEISFGHFKKQAIKDLSTIKSTKELVLTYDNDIQKSTVIHFFNFLDKDKKPMGGIGILFDSSKINTDRETFIKQRDALTHALNGSMEGYWEWDVKTNEVVFSTKAKELLGYTENEKAPETLSAWLNIIESYDLAKTNEALSSHLSGKTPFIDVQHRLKTADAERWINLRGSVALREQGVPSKIYGTMRDISDSKQKEVILEKQRDLFTTFMDNLPALAFIKDKQGKYIYANEYFQKLLGQTPWKNRTVEEIFPKNISSKIIKSDREALYEGVIKSEEILFDEAGIKKLFSTHKFPIENMDGKVLCGFGIDITKEKSYLNRINLYLKVFENANEAIVITDTSGAIVDANKAYLQLISLPKEKLLGKRPNIRSSGNQTPEFYKKMWSKLVVDGAWRGEVLNVNKDGILCTEILSISSIKDENNVVKNFIGIYQNIEHQKLVEAILREQAHFDPLTQLPNRLLFNDRLAESLNRASREKNEMALIFIDLDDFKDINDTKGHEAGDIVLKEIAKRLAEMTRTSDTIARLGGDEFVMILEQIQHKSDLPHIAQKIIDSLTEPIVLDDHSTCKVGASLGISIFPEHASDKDELLKLADKAMYAAKDSGKNCFRIYSSD